MKTKLQVSSADYRKLSDEELIHRFVHRSDHAAINMLFERYGHLVLGVCMKYLKDSNKAKDATQKIFIKLLEDLHKYKIENFKLWLLQVSKNHCLMQLGKNIKMVNREIATNADPEYDEEWNQQIEIEEERVYRSLETAIVQLNKEQRVCVELFYLQKMTYAEIAGKTKYSLQEVKTYLQIGKRNLKIKLEALTGGVRK